MRLLLALLFVFLPVFASAEMPAIPADARPYLRSPCTDMESGERGYCFLYRQTSGDTWMVFTQEGQPVHLRWVPVGEPYITIWTQPEPTY